MRAQDEGKELQVEPTQAIFTVLSPPLQEQAGFKAAVWVRAGHHDDPRQMLAYSGRGRFVIRGINLSDLVRDTAKMLAVSISKNVQLTLRLAANLPWVEADATQLGQIVMNLVINASEAIGEQSGSITLTTCVRRCDRAWLDSLNSPDRLEEGGLRVFGGPRLGVRHGPVHHAQGVRSVLYHQVHGTRPGSGGGLGNCCVAITAPSTSRANWAKARPSRSCCRPPKTAPPPRRPSRVRPTSGATHRQKGTVLLVDDEADLRTVAAKMLERLGYEVLVAKNGLEAIEIAKHATRKIDCALLDWNMPRLNGVETFRQLRLLRPGLSTVLASGYCEEELIQRFGGDGLAGFGAEALHHGDPCQSARPRHLALRIGRLKTGSPPPPAASAYPFSQDQETRSVCGRAPRCLGFCTLGVPVCFPASAAASRRVCIVADFVANS